MSGWYECVRVRRREAEEGKAADTALKTKTRHDNVGKNGEIAVIYVIYSVLARWEAETTANTMVFEGQVAKDTVMK